MSEKTKYIILVGDGMADRPESFPDGRSPLMRAATPNLDAMAANGETGLVKTVPDDMEPGSDVANMALLGYDPRECYSGRAPLEAAAMGVDLRDDQTAFRLNLVHLDPAGNDVLSADSVMGSYSSGHIGTPEAREIIETLRRELGRPGRAFYPGVSYRHLLVLDGVSKDMKLTPPHDISGRPIGGSLPSGPDAEVLLDLMRLAAPILARHPVNAKRAAAGKATANSIWLWGQGGRPAMPTLAGRWGITGAVVSAVDLVKGIGRLLGMEVINVPGATGYLDTNYEGKVSAALDALRRVDFVFLHIEAPDEAGHQGDLEAKIRAIGDFDRRVVGPALRGILIHEKWTVMAVADHPTPIAIKTHSREPVPYAILRSGVVAPGPGKPFDEIALGRGPVLPDGPALMRAFLGR